MTWPLSLAFLVLLLALLVGAHEAGHLCAALALRIRVDEVGLGLPPRLVRLGRRGTTSLTINLVPLGGFVRPAGEHDRTVAGGLAAAPALHRLIVFVAGPAANLILAMALLTTGFATSWPDVVRVVRITPGSPAEAAGLSPGDQILSLDGERVTTTEDLSRRLRRQAGHAVHLHIARDGQTLDLDMGVRLAPPAGQGPAGFESRGELMRYPLPQAAARAAQTIGSMITGTGRALAELLRGDGTSGVTIAGPIGLKQVSDQALGNAVAWEQFYPVLYLAAWFSMAIGLFNLLPWPALDGGHAALALIEMVSGRRLLDRTERRLHVAGMLVLLVLMLVLVVVDVLRTLA
jgi:regulator of sigma E protease